MLGSSIGLKLAIWGAIVFSGAAVGWTVNGWRLGAQISKINATHAMEYAAAQKAAREKEQTLQRSADNLRRAKDDQIKTINGRLTTAISELRDRPERAPGNVPGVAGTCSGVSGAQLARGDASFLTGYAADAAILQEALKQCLSQYNTARERK